jgi:aconitate hydratase
MADFANPFNSLRKFRDGSIYSLPALEKAGLGKISRLPVSIRIVLESVLRNCDGQRVSEEDIKVLAAWKAAKPAQVEIPFVVSRIVLQDFTGVPLLVDLAAMRDAVKAAGKDPALIEPLVPVDLVVDHSVQVDRAGTPQAYAQNLEKEFERNGERYEFLKWGQQAFKTFSVVPPSVGIIHQVNLEYLARLVFEKGGVYYPDTLVGTDSHTTMINGIGVVGWGVGGIEAEAGMLGQPVYFLTPEVIGVHLTGALMEGVTATDLTLRLTQLLRAEKVVGKFVEYFGEGAASLNVADRATIANMAPEYGATMGYFPVDEKTLDYFTMTGRDKEQIALVRDYFKAQGLFGIPKKGEVDYTKVLELDLSTITPCVSGPKRPQDRIELPALKKAFLDSLAKPVDKQGFAVPEAKRAIRVPVKVQDPDKTAAAAGKDLTIGHGSVVIAAITSCTNTSNPSVMIAAGLLASKAVARGLTVSPTVKCSLGPGSRVVTDYLNALGLQSYLDKLGFNLVGYGCTTCIGNSGPLDPGIESAITSGDLVTASVLSGNRNFEARIHGSIKANFLMSPPLVVAFAIAGRVDIDINSEPLGTGTDGKPVFLRDIWPTQGEIDHAMSAGLRPEMFTDEYRNAMCGNEMWKAVKSATGDIFDWKDESTYIQLPPFFENFGMAPGTIRDLNDMRALAVFGDSVTTDHISPAGNIPAGGPAGKFLIAHGVQPLDFNSFGSRRGNDRVMTRGTFANVRIKNFMADGKEGGLTKLQPEGEIVPIFDACQKYRARGTGLIVFAGADYGMGSSRDWAAKGTALLGVKAVVAKSYERIHRSNLLGMGVLPLQFPEGQDVASLGIDGTQTYSIVGLDETLAPRKFVKMIVTENNGTTREITLQVRIDTPVEVQYYKHGGILPYVLRNIIQAS